MSDLSMEEIIRGIVTAALWADLQWPEDHEKGGENGESGGGEREYSVDDVESASIDKLHTLACHFVAANMANIALYVKACEEGERMSYDPSQGTPLDYLGHDIWLSAGGHGAGFWDRGLGELGDRLHEAAKTHFGQFEGSALPWVTSDNMISFE